MHCAIVTVHMGVTIAKAIGRDSTGENHLGSAYIGRGVLGFLVVASVVYCRRYGLG